MTGRSLSALGFLQIYRNKRAQQRKFYANIFSEQLFRENICVKFPLLGSFLVINLKKPQSTKWSTCQSFKKFTLIVLLYLIKVIVCRCFLSFFAELRYFHELTIGFQSIEQFVRGYQVFQSSSWLIFRCHQRRWLSTIFPTKGQFIN